ncbi:MAG TPA: hypothetical protein VMS16_12900 [Mycobacterium sp.]|nr:hypothetical protein [Mycobacterium sp.]
MRVGRQDRGKQTTSPVTDIDYGIDTAEIVRLGEAGTSFVEMEVMAAFSRQLPS